MVQTRAAAARAARGARTGVVAGRPPPRLLLLDRIWLSAPDGKNGSALRPRDDDIERDPAWSRDGRSIVFAADSGQGFDLVVSPSQRR